MGVGIGITVPIGEEEDSMYKLIQTVIGLILLVVLPLMGKPGLLFTWPVILVALGGGLVHLAPPYTPAGELFKSNPNDRGSTYLMMFGAAGLALISILDYAYGRQARPPFLSLASLAGFFLIDLGLSVRQWTIITLGDYFTARVTLEEEHKMIDIGPYHYLRIRHPAYLGTLLVSLGVPIVLRSYLGLGFNFLVMVPAYLYRIAVEEGALATKLQDKYATFTARTKRLIPILY